MIIAVNKSRIKRIALACVLLALAAWSPEGFVICYGADGHVEIERPSDKGCCTTPSENTGVTLTGHAEFNHCVDVPIGAAKYIGSATHAGSCQPHAGLVKHVSSPASSPSPRNRIVRTLREMPQPHNRQLASLKTVVLLI
jgi:hypothetical protein